MKLDNWLAEVKPELLKAMRRTDADFYFAAVRNRAMEELRRELNLRPDFQGAEAEKIRREEMVNVLSFPEPKGFPSPIRGKAYLGEVYLNRDFGGGKPEVLGPLFIHGFLHLLGYHHDGKRDTMRMKKEEKRLWDLISSSDSISGHLPSRPRLRKSRATA